jgi:hypothetical protein
MLTEGIILFGLSILIGGLVWGVRLEGRVNATETRHEDLKDHLREILDSKFATVNVRLDRIEHNLNGPRRKE